MRIQYISDLHLEHYHKFKIKSIFSKIENVADILIVAGDIGYPSKQHYTDFINFISDKYQKIFIILGNHEYYSTHLLPKNTVLEIIKPYKNISLLDDNYEIYKGYCFVGTTLWSNVADIEMAHKYKINDISHIKDLGNIDNYNQLHRKSVEFLQQIFKLTYNFIVITHHIPLLELITENYKDNPYNQWFATDLKYLMNPNIKHWFFGHTHTASENKYYDIEFHCNSIGYPNENSNQNYHKSIDI